MLAKRMKPEKLLFIRKHCFFQPHSCFQIGRTKELCHSFFFFPSNDIPMIKRVSLKNTRELNSCTYANLKASFTFNCLDHQNYQLMNLHQLLVQLLTFDNIKGNAIKWNNITDTRVIKIETIKFWHSKIESKGRFL